jgi:hypothetical protein
VGKSKNSHACFLKVPWERRDGAWTDCPIGRPPLLQAPSGPHVASPITTGDTSST